MNDPRGPVLLALARATIDAALGGPAPTSPAASFLDRPGACFVSLHRNTDGNLECRSRRSAE